MYNVKLLDVLPVSGGHSLGPVKQSAQVVLMVWQSRVMVQIMLLWV